ncbi:MarR family transcriptional regulator [Streptomyces sp. NPDC000070]|uniref:MarR family winged helix-turn-helix transcriptional regulator n=1 Tax=Streptomyces sp. NPDC000070 TaxID=3154240 RepID=UPI00333165FB
MFVTYLNGPGDQAEGPDDGAEAVALEIAGAVESLTNLWSLAVQQAALRLSVPQLRALRALQTAPGANLTALAERLEVGLPTASRLCDRLEAAGLLERTLHPLKRREVQLSLTRNGLLVLTDVAERQRRALAAVLGMMDPAERAALSRGMKAFIAAQDAVLPQTGDLSRR